MRILRPGTRAGGFGRAAPCRARQILPGALPPVNHNAQGRTVPGRSPDRGRRPCASTDRTEPRPSPRRRPRGGRAAAAIQPRPGRRRPRRAGGSRAAHRRRHRCADRAAGGRGRRPSGAGTRVKRGRLALDALDELKIGLLGGTLSPATLGQLKAAAAHLKDGSGDAGLDGVLGEIELRVEVEIAKMAAALSRDEPRKCLFSRRSAGPCAFAATPSRTSFSYCPRHAAAI